MEVGAGIVELVDWLDGKASLVSALATVVIAGLTLLLARENRKLRKAGEEPLVVAYLVPHPDGNGAINIVFANIGMGLAKDVTFKIACDEEDFQNHRVLMDTLRGHAPINVIPSGEKITALFGIGFELFGDLGDQQIAPLSAFSVEISFSDIGGRQTTNTSEINIMQFSGMKGLMNRPAIREIEDTLKRMDKRFEILAKASDKFVRFVDATALEDQVRQYRKGGEGGGDSKG